MSKRKQLIEDDSGGGGALGNINSDSKRQTLLSADLNAGVNPSENQTALGQSKGDISNETQELDNSGGRGESAVPRSPFSAPQASPGYNRFKYYSALRTGY